ncbi:Teneurin-3 [Varanus komodoensis]|nr:Teneurin-3 [Varanus komodoensis]
MTQSVIPFNLMKVHLMVAVVGRLFQKWFPASPNLAYTFIWDKTDAYNQKVYGLSEAVGYEYESCLDLTLWEKRTAILQGYELDASNMGGWTLDKHHVSSTKAMGKISSSLSSHQFSNPAHRYYLATDPVTGELYVSDTNTRRIYRPKSLTGTKDLTKNADVVAGTGEQCLPFDEARCGDGVAIDKNGLIYFVDGTMIRKVDQNGIISTLLGSNDLTSARPLTCDTSMHISQVRLEWPTDLAINPMDNSIYVLDNNVVLQITENRQVRIAAGRPMHCQVPGVEYTVGKHAVQTTLESATAIAVSYNGVLYITETDEKKINRIRQVTTDGEISLVAGIPSECDCKNDANCDCYQNGDGYAKDAKLNAPSSLAVSPDGTLYIADLGNIRIRAVSKNKPLLNSMNFYEVASPTDQELYIFDVNGTHQYTMSLVTGDYLYNFSYSNDNDVTAVTDIYGPLTT